MSRTSAAIRSPREPRRAIALAGAAASALLVGAGTGCADGAGGRTDHSGRTISVQALPRSTPDGELLFRQRRLVAAPGRVTFVFTNPSRLAHNFAVRRGKRRLGITPTIANGARARLPLRLARGTYIFYCAVPGHEATGMHGLLVVR